MYYSFHFHCSPASTRTMRPTTGHSPNAKLPIEMRVQWMEHEQRSRGLEHGDEHFRFFMCTRATLDSLSGASRHGSNSSELSSFQSPILLSKTLQISRSVHLFGSRENDQKKWIENKWNWAFFCFVIVISWIIIIVIICFHWQTQRPPLYWVLTQLFAFICFFNPKIKNSFAVLGRQTG